MSKRPTLYLLDANSLLHRAWHALPPLTNSEGQVVQAVYGVMNTALKLIVEKKPDAFVAAWDTEAPTFRHEAYEAYKATREEKPDELYAQIPLVKEGLQLLGVPSLELDGFEADDIIGTLAKKFVKKGWHITVVTGDRDLLQLIEPHIEVMAFKRGVTDTVMYDAKELQNEYGLTVEQFVEYKAMRGDPSDNIPGIPGIGDKTAKVLLQSYDNLEGIFKAAHDASSDLKPGVRAKLLAAEENMEEVLDLVRIHQAVPIAYKPEPGSARIKDEAALSDFLKRMNFNSLLRRLNLRGIAKKSKRKTRAAEEIAEEAAALSAINKIQKEEQIVVFTGSEEAGTLFGDGLKVLGIAGASETYIFKESCFSSKRVLEELQKVFESEHPSKISHDAKAEMKSLDKIGLSILRWEFDTMLAAYLLAAGERNHDLPAVAETYANQHIHTESTLSEKLMAIRAAAASLKTLLSEENLNSILERFELPLLPILHEMETIGIKIDSGYLRTLSKKLTKRKQDLEKQMVKEAGRDFNPGSPTQLAEVLFVDLKLPTKGIKKGKTGFSTAASELEKLRGAHKIIEHVEVYREISKLLSTYIDVLPTLADKNGRIHTTFQQAVAATGRLSSINPNLQNIPIRTEMGREMRKAFVSEKGFLLLACDYSQIELRIAAALSKDKAMVQAFVDGKDIHTETAASIWGIDAGDVTKEQRRVAKAINFGILFGQGPIGLSQTAHISFAEAKEFIRAYFETYPSLHEYLEQTKAFARKHGYAETFFGRKRVIPEVNSKLPQARAQGERMAINMPIQGTEADIIKLAMIEIKNQIASVSERTKLLLQVHDELLFEVPVDETKTVGAFAKKIMEGVCDLGVPIVVETKEGINWQDMKDL